MPCCTVFHCSLSAVTVSVISEPTGRNRKAFCQYSFDFRLTDKTIWLFPTGVALDVSSTFSTRILTVPPMDRDPDVIVQTASSPASVLPVV